MENDLTYEGIVDAWDEIYDNEISPSQYSDINRYFDDCEAYFDDWLEQMADYFYLTKDEFLTACNNIGKLTQYHSSTRDGLMAIYLAPYIDMAMDEWSDVYYEYPDDQYYCCVCNKPIEYSGDDSVMLLDDKWYEVLDYYNLRKYEEEAHYRSIEFYNKCDRRGGLRLKTPKDIHTFICNDCIEKALGRPIEITDINDSPFNQGYIKSHFETEQ